MDRLSVVIANYNYARFIRHAIDSALALDWPDVEVVVVDDGSTDDSREVISTYGDRVRASFTANSGQREAANHGFSLSTGDVVVFLDADDVLPPQLARSMSGLWAPRVSKVQFQMQRIDVEGAPVGAPFPRWRSRPTPADVERWFRRTSAYPTPPGSGNAYARWFLERVLPAGPEVGDFLDSACLAAAPALGEVVSVPGVCVGYRQHGGNDSALLADHRRFGREVRRAAARWEFAHAVSDGSSADPRPLFRSRELLQFRVAASRTTSDTAALPGDGVWRQRLDALRSPLWDGPEGTTARLLVAVWSLAVACAPKALVGPLLQKRYGAR